MSEAAVLAAFWQPRARRFVELTGQEVMRRCGMTLGAAPAQSLLQRGFITREKAQGLNSHEWIYRLTITGERRVRQMIDAGMMPKPTGPRLTAKPQGGRGMILKEERIGGQRLLLGDCLSIMPMLGRFDACVIDPPYGIGRAAGMGGGGHGKGGKKRNGKRYVGAWDRSRPEDDAFALIMRIADSSIIWGGQFFADTLPPQGKWLWWDKCQTMPSYGDGELAWTNLRGDAPKKFTLGLQAIHASGQSGQHPTQKPVALMEWCLGFLPDAKTIRDPFAGSGTTAVACQRMGRHCTAIELDPDYFAVMCKRVDEAARQPDLFIAPKPEAPKQESLL